jgi:DNA-binding CsgD family transcriptional regulator
MVPERPDLGRLTPQERAAQVSRAVAMNPAQAGTRQRHDRLSGPLVLDVRERTLLYLLATGLTDSSAARRLRVSPRTVTNVLRSLMDRLGVNNRYQLGLALGLAARSGVEPGWLQGAGTDFGRATGELLMCSDVFGSSEG